MPLIAQLALFLCLTLFSWAAPARAEEGEIRLETIPSLDEVRPLADPARIVLTVLDGEGEPLKQGRVRIRLDAPPPGRLLSTDFPLVEGSRLIDMELPVSDGRAEWEYVFPIRGSYRLEVQAASGEKKEMKGLFALTVRENRRKLFYLGSSVAALFLFGFMAGRLFTGKGRDS